MDSYKYHIFSPYRVCPLGAHVDHQHGLVTGFAFDKGVDLWFTPTDDGMVRLKSLTFPGEAEFPINDAVRVKRFRVLDDIVSDHKALVAEVVI